MYFEEQDINLAIGKFGCYLLCLKHIAEKKVKHRIAITEKDFNLFMYYKWIDKDCYVAAPNEILRYWTKTKWSVGKAYLTKEDKNNDISKIKESDYNCDFIIYNWVYNGNSHFMMKDYNSVSKSNVMEKGKIDSIRTIKELAIVNSK